MMCVAKTTKITPKLVNQYDVAEPLTISHTELSVLETPLSVSTYQGDHYWVTMAFVQPNGLNDKL